MPSVADLKALPQPWPAQPIPPIYQKLQSEYDNYQNVVNDPAAAPQQGINAALISLAYLHVDDAIGRLQKVMDKFCNAAPASKGELAPAAKAKDDILAVYQAKDDFDAIEATNRRFIDSKCGDDNSIQLALSQNRSLNFQRAGDRFKKGDFIPAAEAFYRFYKTAQKDDPDLPIALYNAAVAYKLGDRPKTAIALFKEFTAQTDKRFRDSPFYLDAMRLTAASQQASFQYDEAIKSYLDLYDTTKKAKRLGIKPPEPLPGEPALTLDQIGLDAVYNAAFAAEVNRDFKRSVDLYNQYIRIEPDMKKQDKAQLEIAGIYRQAGDVNDMVEALDRWRAKYGRSAGDEDEYVKSYYDTAKLLHAKGRTPQAKQAEQATIDAWKKLGAAKGTKGAKMASEFALADAEDAYAAKWAPLEIKKAARTVAEVKQQRAELEKSKKDIEDKYLALDQFGVVETSMAAKVRYGDIQYDFGQKVGNIPVPTPIANNPDAVAAYQNQLDDNLKKYLAEAKTDWSSVLDASKQGGVSNRWSQHAAENLSREFPEEFHTLRQELVQGTDRP